MRTGEQLQGDKTHYLSFPLVLSLVRDEVNHSFIEGGGVDISSRLEKVEKELEMEMKIKSSPQK